MRCIVQELEEFVAHAHGAVPWQMAACFSPADSSPADREATEAIYTYMCTADAAAAAAASHLHQLYSAFNPPSVCLLQQPHVS